MIRIKSISRMKIRLIYQRQILKKKAEDIVSNEDKSVEIKVYVSNDDATAFVSESVKIDELTSENIVKVLIREICITIRCSSVKV